MGKGAEGRVTVQVDATGMRWPEGLPEGMTMVLFVRRVGDKMVHTGVKIEEGADIERSAELCAMGWEAVQVEHAKLLAAAPVEEGGR